MRALNPLACLLLVACHRPARPCVCTEGYGFHLPGSDLLRRPRRGDLLDRRQRRAYPLRATIADLHIEDSELVFEGWGEPDLVLEGCTLCGNGQRADEVMAPLVEACGPGGSVGDLTVLSGPDRVFFTEDDPWRR